ncbi:GntR family transcriptional regulator [bacterium]|nr:GntR family transcriptional regulator [bacterium]
MILNLTDLSDESLQTQISRQVRAQILAGDLGAGTGLPSIRALARDQKVSVITVQRAYEHLIHEGVIHARRGKGFYVSELKMKEKIDLAESRLADQIRRPVSTAKAEGLSPDDIQRIVKLILNEN